MHSSVQRKDSGNKKGKSYKDLPFGPSVIIGFQKTQIYQRFAGSRQEVIIPDKSKSGAQNQWAPLFSIS